MKFPTDLTLRSARLTLSPLTLDDATTFFGIQSDPQVMRYWNHGPWIDIHQAVDAIRADQQAHREGTRLRLGLRRHDTGELIGTCLLFALEESSRRGEMGYNLAASAQGQGYMAEALGRFTDFLFDDLQLRRLEAEIDPVNAPSAKALERLGFRQEGLLRQRWVVEGHTSDSALYGLLSTERLRRGLSTAAALTPSRSVWPASPPHRGGARAGR